MRCGVHCPSGRVVLSDGVLYSVISCEGSRTLDGRTRTTVLVLERGRSPSRRNTDVTVDAWVPDRVSPTVMMFMGTRDGFLDSRLSELRMVTMTVTGTCEGPSDS